MEAWDVVLVGSGLAAHRAASESAKNKANTLILSIDDIGTGDAVGIDGIAAPLQEPSPQVHTNDTIVGGDYLSDQDLVYSCMNSAIKQVDFLEKCGVVFQRDAKGLPDVKSVNGHSKPRLVTSGDSLNRETFQVLEEQCIKHGVVRRGNQLPVSLVTKNEKVVGIIVLDMNTGRLESIQAKTVIIADSGFESSWRGRGSGIGMDLAFRAGISLRDMEFQYWSIFISDTEIQVPHSLIADGAEILSSNGEGLGLERTDSSTQIAQKIEEISQAVLDARTLNGASPWWQSWKEMVQKRTGIDPDKQTLPIDARVSMTIGGIPIDEHGRAILNRWSRWFTGLYAAGESACSGIHGADAIAGNRLLDNLVTASSAGIHAAQWALKTNFSGTQIISEELERCQKEIDNMLQNREGDVYRIGSVGKSLQNLMMQKMNFHRSEEGLKSAEIGLVDLVEKSSNLYCDDASTLYNDNLRANLTLQAAIRLCLAATRSAMERKESRGSHIREDFIDKDASLLHHSLINANGEYNTLAIRKGPAGSWLLAPEQ